ncbi:MAG: polysaccharide biosynthesis protein [Lachnospiraceae bacterium]|nr:polysaccharide biosynthesis protein [Lachnospiraceae bacterium]
MPKKQKRALHNTNFIVQGGVLGIAGIITRIIGLFYRVPVTNIIGDEGNGYYAAAYQIYSIMLLISSYSLPIAISKIVSARYSKKQYENSARVFRGGLIFSFITGGIVCILVYFQAEFFAEKLMSEAMSAIALRVFAPTLLIVALMGVVRGYFQGMGTMLPTAVSQIVEQIINAIVSILAARFLYGYGLKVAALLQNDHYAPAFGAAGSTIGTSAGALGGLLILMLILLLTSGTIWDLRRREYKENPGHKVEGMPFILKMIFLTAVPVILSTAIYNISDVIDNGMFNKIMTLKGKGIEKTAIWGIYSGKYKLLVNVPIALSNAMSASTVPALSAAIAAENYRGARKKTAQAMRFTMMISFPCFVGLFVLAKPVLSMLFTGDLELASKLLMAGSVSVIFFSMSTLSNGILQGISRMRVPVRNAAIALVIHVTVLYLMLEKLSWGIWAVLVANIIFALIMCILNHMAIRKYLNYRQETLRTFIIPAIASAIMGIATFAVYKLFSLFSNNLVSTLCSIVIGVMVYFVSVMKLHGIREEEMRELPKGGLLVALCKQLRLL